jgi:hypothetical protein
MFNKLIDLAGGQHLMDQEAVTLCMVVNYHCSTRGIKGPTSGLTNQIFKEKVVFM